MAYRNCDGIEFLKSLPDRSVDGVFSDPPWGYARVRIRGQRKWKKLLRDVDRECMRVLRPCGRVLIWVGTRALKDTILSFRNLEYKWMMLYHYIPPRYFGCYFSDCDPILLFQRPGEKMFYRKGKYIPQFYIKPSTGRRDTGHPCARPAEIVKKLLHQFFGPGEYVVDPFAGSDTVGMACRDLGIKYDTCEIDSQMYRFGVQRNSQGFLFEDRETRR